MNEMEYTQNNLSSVQQNLKTKTSIFNDKAEQDQDSASVTSIMIHRNQLQRFDLELQDIPMRNGESVDLEQINDTNIVQSQRIPNAVNIISKPDLNNNGKNPEKNNKNNSDSHSSSYFSKLSKNNKKIELDKSLQIQMEQIKQKIFTLKDSQDSHSFQLQLYFKLLISLKRLFKKVSNNLRIFNKMTELQHAFIGDNASNFMKNRSCNSGNRIIKLINCLDFVKVLTTSIFSRFPVFSPYHRFKLIWDSFIALMILAICFLLSIIVFFQMDEQPYQLFYQFCFILFTFNIIVSLNTAVLVKGKLILNHISIIKVYFSKTFIIDQIGMIPIYLKVSSSNIDTYYEYLLNILILFKIFELRFIVVKILSVLYYQKNMKNTIDLLRLVFIIGCICHIFCLFWHGLAMYEISIGRMDTWLHSKNLASESSILIKYIYSFYFLSVTMITVGYGDITPQNPIEMTFTILTMFVTGFFWAYSLNKIGKIISNTEMQDKSFKESMQVIHAFMRQENVDSELRAKVSNYLQYYYKVTFLNLKRPFIKLSQYQQQEQPAIFFQLRWILISVILKW